MYGLSHKKYFHFAEGKTEGKMSQDEQEVKTDEVNFWQLTAREQTQHLVMYRQTSHSH